jgi:hypothetical protein
MKESTMRLPGWTPRNDRNDVSINAIAVRSDGREMRVRLIDLSMEGCRIQAADTPQIGERMRLYIEGFEDVSVSVRWSLDGTAGLRFEDGDA